MNRGSKGGCISHRDKQVSQNPRKEHPLPDDPLRRKESERCGEAPWVTPRGTEQKGRGRDEGTRKPGAETRRRGELRQIPGMLPEGTGREQSGHAALPCQTWPAWSPAPPPAQVCLGSLKVAAVNRRAQAEPNLNPNYTFSWWANL